MPVGAASQSNSPGNRFCQSVCSLRYWSISRALIQIFSRETPSDSRKCSHTSSFLTMWRASVRSASMNCASFMPYGNMKSHGFLIVLFYAHYQGVRYSVGCPLSTRRESSSRTLFGSDRRDQTSHPPVTEARIGLADDGRVESANDSIASKVLASIIA